MRRERARRACSLTAKVIAVTLHEGDDVVVVVVVSRARHIQQRISACLHCEQSLDLRRAPPSSGRRVVKHHADLACGELWRPREGGRGQEAEDERERLREIGPEREREIHEQ